MNAYTIKDLENLSGVKAHTIRIWEQRYSFLKPQRTSTNIRYYSCEELKSVLNIALLNKYGFKISHIDRMCANEMQERLISLTHSQAQQERVLNELLHYMVDLDVCRFEKTLDLHIAERGLDKCVSQLIFPFLDKTGLLWSNNINPCQEHLVSHIIRQKLVAAIGGCDPGNYIDKLAVLFLPEGEHQDLGLLYMNYVFKNQGITVMYLGGNVPLKDVHFVSNVKNPDFLYTHLSGIGEHFNFARYLTQV
ncbi:MAG: MerR family transcriptional regulator, partial [Sphingobacteriales bacterium]